ncbi:uncharacterized protein LOC133295821 [Gastrolobium bilobum]|uniref:uncharacterized protein LOC133295821 n=1 Tax=Gastrolobium bilobum TaxID=150636 RepID=UPI002AAF6529|nr:uncharacterized protein LOC133295821 [Gastrolobium bilobum]
MGPDLAQETTEQIEMIRDRLKKAQSRQKSCYDAKHRPLEFFEGDHIIKRVRLVAYQLALPPNLANLHDVFHVSQLRRYISDDSHIVQPDDIDVNKDLKFVVGPSKVVARDEKWLRNRVTHVTYLD